MNVYETENGNNLCSVAQPNDSCRLTRYGENQNGRILKNRKCLILRKNRGI